MPGAPRIYLSGPRPSSGTPTESSALRALATLFPRSKIVDPLELFHSNEEWLSRYRSAIRKSSGFVFSPYRATIDYRAYCELCAAEDAGLPTYLFSGGKLWDTWSLSILGPRHQWIRFARITARGDPIDPSAVTFARARRLLPSGPLGRVIENRMIEYLIVLSEGRLIVYRPESDFGGTDLQVSLLHRKPVLKIQVKGRTARAQGRYTPFQVLASQIPEEDPKQLLFTEYDLKAADFREWVWLVDTDDYRANANFVKGYYKASLGTKATAADKWVDFRHNTKDIAWVVEEMLRAL